MEKNVIVVASVLGIQSPSGLQLIHGNRTVTDLKHVAKIKEAMKRGENPLLSAIRYNSNSKKWSTADYVKAYIVDGRESYDILRKFCQRRQEWFPI